MKSIVLILLLLICMTNLLFAEKAGEVKFVCGDVKYKSPNSAKFTKISIKDIIDMNGVLKTEMDSEVEIKWLDNTTSTVSANKTVSVKKVYDESRKSKSRFNKLEDKLNQLSMQNKQTASTVAAIRRDEAEDKVESELYWDVDPAISLNSAIELYQQQKLEDATKIFQKIVEQAPLSKDAENSIGYLIIIFDKTGDQKNLDLYKKKLHDDFPNSQFKDLVDNKN